MTLVFIFYAAFLASCVGRLTSEIQKDFAAHRSIQVPQESIEFLAYQFAPMDRTHCSNEPVKLEKIKYNNGNYYDIATGYFTSASKGLYVFNFTSDETIENRIRLMKNDYEVIALSKDGKRKGRMKEKILLQLETEDRVWLRLACGKHKNEQKIDPNSAPTTFSGRLLTADANVADSHSSSGHNLSRRKRSPEASDSLRRQIRAENFPPVSFVSRSGRSSAPVMSELRDYDVTGKTASHKIAFSVASTKSIIGGRVIDTTETRDGDMSLDPARSGQIRFDKTFVNVGGGFDMNGAEFTAPTGGVYFFSYNVGKFPRKKLSVMLIKNFNEVQSIIFNDSKSRARGMQGQNLMLQLQSGDKIWIRSFNAPGYAVYSNLGNYITFTGYLVYAA